MLLYIQKYTAEHGYAPSLAEIASEIGVVKSHVHYLIRRAAGQGYLSFVPNTARSYRVI